MHPHCHRPKQICARLWGSRLKIRVQESINCVHEQGHYYQRQPLQSVQYRNTCTLLEEPRPGCSLVPQHHPGPPDPSPETTLNPIQRRANAGMAGVSRTPFHPALCLLLPCYTACPIFWVSPLLITSYALASQVLSKLISSQNHSLINTYFMNQF